MFTTLLLLAASFAHADEASNRIRTSEDHTRGKSLQTEVSMTVDRGGSTRSLKFRLWTEGRDKAVIKILEPVKDRDTGNLRQQLNLWQFLPNIDRLVKIPPSMMLQSWMGSDFTNDDLVRTSSLTSDYTHKIEGHEKIGAFEAVRILCSPKPDAPVVWGKILEWVRVADSVPLKREFYSENGEKLKVMEGTEIKTFGAHTIPTRMEMRDLKRPGHKTVLIYDKVRFDEALDGAIFRQEFLRKPVR